MKRTVLIKPLSAALAAVMLMSGCGAAGSTGSENTSTVTEEQIVEKTYLLTEENVKLVGRTYMEDDVLWCALSGTGFEFTFTGKKLDLSIIGSEASEIADNDGNWARYAVYVDGERKIDRLVDSKYSTVNVIDSETEVTSVVRFIKLSETAMSTIGIQPIVCDGTIAPTAAKNLKLEIIGDSITCGYGVDDEDANHQFKTATEDFTKAYAYKTAQLLDADYSAFSISGWGIFSGYTTGDTPIKNQRLPKFYKYVGFSYNRFTEETNPQSAEWDFGRYVPDLIVINLGTNDDSYCRGMEDRCADYEEAYINFLKTVHEKNPTSKILCVLGVMGDRLYPSVEKVVEAFKTESGFEDIYSFRLTPQDGKLGYAADWHPTAATHDRAAAELSEKIKEIM